MIDTRDDELERRLVRALHAKAGQVTDMAGDRFDATVLTDAAPAPSAPRRRTRAFAAALLAAAAATAVVVATRPGSHAAVAPGTHRTGTATSTPVPTTAAMAAPNPVTAPLLAPAWVPAGQQLWSLVSAPAPGADPFTTQLFGTVAADGTLAPGVLVELQSVTPGSGLGSGTPVQVRGQNGVSRASKDAGDAPFEVDWIEGNVEGRATGRGATVAQVVAVLDALHARSTDLMAGFDPAGAPSGYGFLGEQLSTTARTATPDTEATFEYSANAPVAGARPDFTVRSDTAATYPGYLRTWMAGRRAADGSAIALDPMTGLAVAWSNGRQVTVQSSATTPDPAVLEHVARSVDLLDETPAAKLAGEAQARVDLELQGVGNAPLPAGDVELHGNGAPTAVCFTVLGGTPACSDPFAITAGGTGSEGGALPGFVGSAAIGGKWYVFVAASAPITVNAANGDPLAAETAQVAGMHLALVVVPDNVDGVQLTVPIGANGSAGTSFVRPV